MKTSDKKQLGETIRLYRKAKTLNQTQLADQMGVMQSTISRWEAGIDEPNIEHMSGLVSLFGCTYNDLLGDSSDRNQEEQRLLSIYRSLPDEKKEKLMKFISEIL